MVMITTNQINVKPKKGKTPLERVSTKNVDASSKTKPPETPIKPTSISTHQLDEKGRLIVKETVKEDGKGLEKLNLRFAFVDFFCENTIQGLSRRELK